MSQFELPEGWTGELMAGGDVFLVKSPSGYMTTLDLKARGFRCGFSLTGPMTSTKSYVGRGWWEAMKFDALEILRKLEVT